jgi:subtilisin family serine protease
MKKLLYWGAGLALVATLFYTNLERIANWWFTSKDAKEMPKSVDELPYYKNQFIVTFPKDAVKAKAVELSLAKYGLKRYAVCKCSENYALYGTPDLKDVKIFPDTEVPDTTMVSFNRNSAMGDTSAKINVIGYNIVRNYKLLNSYPSGSIMRSPAYNGVVKLPKNGVREVKVAIVDTGVDTLLSGLEAYLFRNTGNPLICDGDYMEGTFGLNILNRTMAPNNLEPIDMDEKYDYKCPFTTYRHGHGTLINGIIAGLANYPNRQPATKEMNVKLKLLNVKFVEKRAENSTAVPEGSLFDALCGVHYALKKGVKVINASWGVMPLPENLNSVRNAFSITMADVYNANAILVTSAGNDGIKNNDDLPLFPASLSRHSLFKNNVITVGAWATQPDSNKIASFSNEGSFVDVYAPGRQISAPYAPSGWFRFLKLYKPQNGTSFAAPFITREVAIIMGENPSYSPERIKQEVVNRSPVSTSSSRVRIFTPNQ